MPIIIVVFPVPAPPITRASITSIFRFASGATPLFSGTYDSLTGFFRHFPFSASHLSPLPVTTCAQ
jgi:hypothetical protein